MLYPPMVLWTAHIRTQCFSGSERAPALCYEVTLGSQRWVCEAGSHSLVTNCACCKVSGLVGWLLIMLVNGAGVGQKTFSPGVSLGGHHGGAWLH